MERRGFFVTLCAGIAAVFSCCSKEKLNSGSPTETTDYDYFDLTGATWVVDKKVYVFDGNRWIEKGE